jgi:DNA-binding response OmpR family regulator
MDELLARVRRALRRDNGKQQDAPVVTTASFTADLGAHTVSRPTVGRCT